MELWIRTTQFYNSAEEKSPSPKVKTFPDLGVKKRKPSTKLSEKLCTPRVPLDT